MMIAEHHHGTFMVTLQADEVDALTAKIEGEVADDEYSPCCAWIAQTLLEALVPPAQPAQPLDQSLMQAPPIPNGQEIHEAF